MRRATPILFLLLLVSPVAPARGGVEVFPMDPPAGAGAMAPNLYETPRGVGISWLEPVADGPNDPDAAPLVRMRHARLAGRGWSPALTITEGRDLFVNWADRPAIVRGSDGALLAHWLKMSSAGTYSYDVVLARSTDDGATWTPLGPAHDDGTNTEHGFVSAVDDAAGVRLFWLDGREMTVEGHADEDDGHGHGGGDMTLRTAVVGTEVTGGARLDDRVCECCGTSAARTATGAVVVYRDRGPDETRDIAIVCATPKGWTAPRPVHVDGWRIAGCPVNGPVAAARGDLLAVAWYTGATEQGAVRLAFSRDGGGTFAAPLDLDVTRPMGRVDLVFDADGRAVVAWLDTGDEGGVIRLCRVDPDAGPEALRDAPVAVTTTTTSRASGFPRIAQVDGDTIVAWTEDADETRVRLAVVRWRD